MARTGVMSLGQFADHWWVLGSTDSHPARVNTKTRRTCFLARRPQHRRRERGPDCEQLRGPLRRWLGKQRHGAGLRKRQCHDPAQNLQVLTGGQNNGNKFPGATFGAPPGGGSGVTIAFVHPGQHPAKGPMGSLQAVPKTRRKKLWAMSGVFEVGPGDPPATDANPQSQCIAHAVQHQRCESYTPDDSSTTAEVTVGGTKTGRPTTPTG